MKFPPFPRSNEDIRTYAGPGEYMACAIVHNHSVRQLMAFRKLRLAMGDPAFKDALCESLDVLARATGIRNPAGWLYDFLAAEAASNVSQLSQSSLVKGYVHVLGTKLTTHVRAPRACAREEVAR